MDPPGGEMILTNLEEPRPLLLWIKKESKGEER
jgi:hypothetical protein